MHNEQNLKNTPEYRSGMFRIVTCPVCGYPTLDMYWICEHCGWEYDIELQTEDEESPCNGMSLRAYRDHPTAILIERQLSSFIYYIDVNILTSSAEAGTYICYISHKCKAHDIPE